MLFACEYLSAVVVDRKETGRLAMETNDYTPGMERRNRRPFPAEGSGLSERMSGSSALTLPRIRLAASVCSCDS